jgi:hypothetical protein
MRRYKDEHTRVNFEIDEFIGKELTLYHDDVRVLHICKDITGTLFNLELNGTCRAIVTSQLRALVTFAKEIGIEPYPLT